MTNVPLVTTDLLPVLLKPSIMALTAVASVLKDFSVIHAEIPGQRVGEVEHDGGLGGFAAQDVERGQVATDGDGAERGELDVAGWILGEAVDGVAGREGA